MSVKKASASKVERTPAPLPPTTNRQIQRSDPDTRRPKAQTLKDFPIVGIGASAGGLEAFTGLLGHLPLDTGMGFVLVQHLDPAHRSSLTELLAKTTKLPVREVMNDLRVEPNHVYVIPPNRSPVHVPMSAAITARLLHCPRQLAMIATAAIYDCQADS